MNDKCSDKLVMKSIEVLKNEQNKLSNGFYPYSEIYSNEIYTAIEGE